MQRSIFLGFLLFLNLYAKTSVAGMAPPPSNCPVVAESVRTYCEPILKTRDLQAAPLSPCCLALKVVQTSNGIFGCGRMCHCIRVAMNSTGPYPTISPASRPIAESAGALIVGGGADVDISIQLQSSCAVNLGFSLDVNVPCPET